MGDQKQIWQEEDPGHLDICASEQQACCLQNEISALSQERAPHSCIIIQGMCHDICQLYGTVRTKVVEENTTVSQPEQVDCTDQKGQGQGMQTLALLSAPETLKRNQQQEKTKGEVNDFAHADPQGCYIKNSNLEM